MFSPVSRIRAESPWGVAAIGSQAYVMLSVAVVAQVLTVLITWPLWEVRTVPPHLPAFVLPQFLSAIPFGWLMLASLAGVLVRPRLGVVLHASVLAIACVFDQYRTQPQFIYLALFMFACIDQRCAGAARWLLASVWVWAGLHKFLSVDWFGHWAWNLTGHLGLPQDEFYWAFAFVVAISELLLGLAAIFAPRQAAYGCFIVHVGIAIFLSPLFSAWNYSVIPWNLCTAIVGSWLLMRTQSVWPAARWEIAFAAGMLLLPAGFYLGIVDHGVAGVLYSDNLPKGYIITHAGSHQVDGWGSLNVPFPSERRLFKQHFAYSPDIPAGSKLHLADPRHWLEDEYHVKLGPGESAEITAAEFYSDRNDAVPGVGLDSRRSVFALSQAGVVMLKRDPESMIYAVSIPPARYHPDLLPMLAGLPNLEQLQLADCLVTDLDLALLPSLPKLQGLGLSGTDVTDAGLQHLEQFSDLVLLEYDDTQISAAAADELMGDFE